MADEMRKALIDTIVGADIRLVGTDGKSYAEVYADALLEAGAIFPPCKVNDKVYYISLGEIKTAKVVEIYYNGDTFAYRVQGKYTSFDIQGRDAYFTLEAAQLALKGGKNNG